MVLRDDDDAVPDRPPPLCHHDADVDAPHAAPCPLADSGCCGQDVVDEGDSDTSSEAYSDSGSESSVKDAMRNAMSLATPLSFEGDINVENSTNVQFGNNTHYHGPVTVLLSTNKTVNGVPAVLPGGSDDLVLSAKTLSVGKDSLLPVLFTPSTGPPPRQRNDVKSLLAGLAEDKPLWTRRRLAVAAVVSAALIGGAVVACISLLPPKKDVGAGVAPVKLPSGLTLVPRDQWLAQPARDGVDTLTTPVDYVILHHSATDSCYNFPECILRTRYIQMFHMESQNWSDISYNFLVGGDGYVYVGRDWDKVGAHTFNWNHRSVGVCLIGTFSYQRPTNEQMRAVTKLVEYGVRLGNIAPEYKLAGACQFRSTESPGKLVYEDITKWDHWWNFTTGDSNCKIVEGSLSSKRGQ